MHERSQEVSSQTFGDSLGFNPHCYIIVTDGCFYGTKGMYRVAPPFEMKKLEAFFRHGPCRLRLCLPSDALRRTSQDPCRYGFSRQCRHHPKGRRFRSAKRHRKRAGRHRGDAAGNRRRSARAKPRRQGTGRPDRIVQTRKRQTLKRRHPGDRRNVAGAKTAG